MNIVTLLQETLQETEEYFALSEDDLQRTYGKDKWSIRKILVHLADAEGVLHERVKRIIAEPRQVLWAFDQELWCEHLAYETFPLEISKSLFMATRKSNIYLAGKYYVSMGNKEYIHSQTGIRTLKDEFDKIAFHNRAHIRHVEAALKNGS